MRNRGSCLQLEVVTDPIEVGGQALHNNIVPVAAHEPPGGALASWA